MLPADVSILTPKLRGLAGGVVSGGGVDPFVFPVTMFDSPPNTASTFKVPLKATRRNWYCVAAESPATAQVKRAPILDPETGAAQVPAEAEAASPQAIVGAL